jgi:hypothetical protein
VALRIFLKILGFSECFSCLVSIFWNFRICFCAGKYFEKNKILSYPIWAELVGSTRSASAQAARPARAHLGSAAKVGLAMPPPPSAGVLGTPGAAAPPYKGEGSSPTPSAAAPCLALPRPAPPPDRAGELGIDFEFRPPPFVPAAVSTPIEFPSSSSTRS